MVKDIGSQNFGVVTNSCVTKIPNNLLPSNTSNEVIRFWNCNFGGTLNERVLEFTVLLLLSFAGMGILDNIL